MSLAFNVGKHSQHTMFHKFTEFLAIPHVRFSQCVSEKICLLLEWEYEEYLNALLKKCKASWSRGKWQQSSDGSIQFN